MKKFLFILLGVLCLGAGAFMIIAGLNIIISGSGINHSLIDSTVDKIFFLLLFIGCGLCYIWTSVFLFDTRLFKKNALKYAFLASVYAAMAGVYYSIMFGSPW